jgi:F-type H+-transporting ATPase subunit b
MIESTESVGVLATLGINGWQFFAQLVNFSIVLFVMWKWVYTPLLTILEKRKNDIQEGIDNGKLASQRLQDASLEKERLLKDARVEAHSILEDIKSKAEIVRQEKLTLAKSEIEKHIQEAKEQIKTEREAAATSLKREVASLVVLATEKVVAGLSDAQKQELTTDAIKNVSS